MSETSAELKSAIYLMVAKMVEEQTGELSESDAVIASPTYVAALVELVYNQIVNLGEDLELFANHADRTTIKPSDLYMVTRKNEALTRILQDLESELHQRKK